MTLIVVGGLPGAGKSSLAEALALRLRAPVFSKDRIEAPLRRNGVTAEANSWQVAEDLLTTLASEQLREVSQRSSTRSRAPNCRERHGGRSRWNMAAGSHSSSASAATSICTARASRVAGVRCKQHVGGHVKLKSGGHGLRHAAPIVSIASLALVAGTAVATASTSQAKTVPVKKWATAVCTDLGKWEHRLIKLSARGALTDPAAGKAAITKFVNGALKATDTLAKQLKAAGAPSVKDGKAVEAGLVTATKSLRAAYATAKTGADALPTTDATVFSAAAKALAAQLQTANEALTTTLADAAQSSPGGALDKAFTSTKACTKLT